MAKFKIGEREYASKRDAKSDIQSVLRGVVPPCDLTGSDNDLLVDLLGMHPNCVEKLGAGLGYFRVIRDDRGSACFAHVDRQGTEIVFSYLVCLNPALASPESSVKQALRMAVEGQVRPLRRYGHEVDHANPGGFAGLARRFIDHCGGADRVLTEKRPDGFGRVMIDEYQIFLWQEFHRQVAVLEVVTVEEHRARTKERSQ